MARRERVKTSLPFFLESFRTLGLTAGCCSVSVDILLNPFSFQRQVQWRRAQAHRVECPLQSVTRAASRLAPTQHLSHSLRDKMVVVGRGGGELIGIAKRLKNKKLRIPVKVTKASCDLRVDTEELWPHPKGQSEPSPSPRLTNQLGQRFCPLPWRSARAIPPNPCLAVGTAPRTGLPP